MIQAALLAFAVLAAPAAETARLATNTKDPVCKMAVTAKSATVAVRGQFYRVCNRHCGEALQKDPDKFLEKDGSVKATK
jgi:YHS domain-containing protein